MTQPPTKHTFLSSAVLYLEPRILGILFLGFSSGLPFLLTLATLHVWLTEAGLSKTTIGLFAAVTIPYSLKFIWAPLIDRVQIPFLSQAIGHRKSWMILSQVMLIFTLICLGRSSPSEHIFLTAFCALCVSFFSATQDVCIEAYRVQKLPVHETGIGAGASHLGYRFGMWVSGAGALYLASFFSWAVVYGMMAGFMMIGIVTVLLSQEPDKTTRESVVDPKHTNTNFAETEEFTEKEVQPTKARKPLWTWIKLTLTSGISQTVSHLRSRGDLAYILTFIILFKLVDTFLNSMTMPFLLEIGFNKIQIANVGKTFGIGAMILGGLLAGMLLTHHRLHKVLVWCIGLQLCAALLFWGQANLGPNIYHLFFAIGLDNLANGMSFAAFITYLSRVSISSGAGSTKIDHSKSIHSGTHFAFLTSIASFARVLFSYVAGVFADLLAWDQYYLLTALATLPLVGLLYLKKQNNLALNSAN